MYLYLISQDVNDNYDTYDSAVVAAENEEMARKASVGTIGMYGTWVSPENVKVRLIGKAVKGTEPGVILASFNAS